MGDMEQKDLLSDVCAALEKRVGDLRLISKESGVAYDTVLRIKNKEGEPGYFKVRALAKYFGLLSPKPRTNKQTKAEA